MKIGSLFSGIGGLELGLERAGLGRVAWQVEIDPFCRRVLAKHWPHAERFEDVRRVGKANLAPVDLICGGFPCQDVSVAGKGAGLEGERSGLWSEYLRIVAELGPSLVVIENVPGLRTRGLRRVLADLSGLGFDAEWSCLAAADVGAPHLRKRLFIVASHPDRIQLRDEPGWLERASRTIAAEFADAGEGRTFADAKCVIGWAHGAAWNHGDRDQAGRHEGADRPQHAGEERALADPDRQGQPQQSGVIGAQWRRSSDGSWWPPVSPVRGVDDGIPNRSHGRRLKALGNSVVPQVAEVIGRAIAAAIEERRIGGEW